LRAVVDGRRRVHEHISPFRIEVPDAELENLRRRLALTRWPDRETVQDWSQGVPLAYLKDLCGYWAQDYDWRRAEASLNALPQGKASIDGLSIHFLHVRSQHEDALPLLLTHGWPGSVLEFIDVIGPLVDPTAHGAGAEHAFHVICPSLPGYGFSDKPARPGWDARRIADAWAELMLMLGYERYGAQGGDWGAMVTSRLAERHPERLVGIHLNMLFLPPRELDAETDAERDALAAYAAHRRWDAAYSKQQSTRPQTLAYGLADSPAAQCAWILEKLWAWTDCDGDPLNVVSRDALLDNVTLYWLTGSAGSSARLYWESFRDLELTPLGVPAGFSRFPKEILPVSRRWAERRLANLRYFNELDRGGHFAALEQPQLFVGELRNFFGLVR
jgi:pimeloyl-ACP methyl ester carboxylesterase